MRHGRQFLLRRLAMVGLLLGCFLGGQGALAQETPQDPPLRWWKGNLHTHSLWSDGDDFPEMIAAWYAKHDYNFLALSDHNVLSQGIRWMPLDKIVARSDEGVLDRYRARFGPAWVETQPANGSGGELEVRLKPLDEFRCLLEQAGKFILIPGEELSDQADGKPVHMNATNVTEALQPVGGATVEEVIRNNLRLILEHEHDSGRQLLAHLNHPNFHYAVTAEDLARVVEEQFFEVYNGHPGVNHLGDDEHMSIETMWDVINAMRMVALDADPILGIATDDSHEYHGQPGSRPGRGWVMVRARYLTPEHLIRAIKAGEFYASSGVVLDDVRYDAQAKQLSLAIRPAPGATYTTEFIALKKPAGAAPEGETAPGELPEAEVVARVSGLQPSYQLSGDEFYVRALVTSSLGADDPSFADQKRQAWTQPVGWRAARSGQP